MINEQYSINEEAIRSLILYLKNLRKEHTTIKKYLIIQTYLIILL